MTLLIPRYETQARVSFDRITRALLTHDQYDDWLPDPVYYEDQRNDFAGVLARFRGLWQADSIPTPAVELLELPRRSDVKLPAVALPLGWRLCAHAIITEMSGRVKRALPRDKVYGFRFLEEGSRVFDAPGQELDAVFKLVQQVAQATREEVFEVLDIVRFSETARSARLAQTLQQCGARADECNFLTGLIGSAGGGLPSIDDAFAFAYNFYLQPVDAALVRRKHNFFRFRDEYYVFDDAARSATVSQLAAIGLQARVLGRSLPLSDVESDMRGVLTSTRSKRQTSERVLELPAVDIEASLECTSIYDEEPFCTDFSEVKFAIREPSVESLFVRRVDGPPLDAVAILPSLRALHEARAEGVLLAPPFTTATASFQSHRAQLARHRTWLNQALEAALRANEPWQAGWSAALLSDVGTLTEQEIGLLLRVIRSQMMNEPARMQARIALARSSTISADRFWTTVVPQTEYRRRALLVGARHLARRNPVPWDRLRNALGSAQPQLIRHLLANIQVPA